MSEEKSGPLEMGAEMDYSEHDRTYAFFLSATKWGTVFCVALLIAMAFGFFTTAGFFSATILFIVLNIGAFFLLR
ncbi:aa3-type cytochrome c oxidase subunit IV [Georhizobium profundi]|jgi:hypothetical protein|uniref:Aa3-type cytochrome c oxidase subunit IV n=1 Tax=Georhizobium profundi TaxID=2341112 RepID=A0A3Q8XR38_9HYPH|nr:aa3-type cytochrome c oxidase subunit IV [Georhizobium profundi]AZN73226.1 aa3-type cytochrome c oxidase subunit IV [Georhizobium profundi]GLQ38008.1 hypothetical protein GCM10007908_16280 [Rhizobium albus]